MNINQFNLTPIIVLTLIVLGVFCLFGAVLSNRDMFNVPEVAQQSTLVHQPPALTATYGADRLIFAGQQATLDVMQMTAIPPKLTLQSQYSASTQIVLDQEATREAKDAAATKFASETERKEMRAYAEAFAISAYYYLLPFLLLALAVMVGLLFKSVAATRRSVAEAKRIDAHRQLCELREKQRSQASLRQKETLCSPSQVRNSLNTPIDHGTRPVWPDPDNEGGQNNNNQPWAE